MRRFFVGLAITAMLGMIPGQVRGNDRQISQSIVKGLQAEQKNKTLSGFNIDLEVDNGTVYLKGTVSSEEQEKLAIDIVRRVEGVTEVYNELEIAAPKKSPAVSKRIEKEAPVLEEPEELTPQVESLKEETAEVVAVEEEATPKVNGILSSLKKVTPASARRPVEPASATAPASDSENGSRDLAERIINRLRQEKAAGNLQGFAIDVEVDRGVARLNGKVTTHEQQNRVLDIVRRISGVKQVVNGLSITQQAKTPTDIAQQIVSSLQEKKASGELKNFSVDVEVDRGVVWLTGQAANDSQQQIILDTARYIPGVTKVVNDLVVKAPIVQAQQATAKAAIVDEDSDSDKSPPQPLLHDDEEGPIGSAVVGGSRVTPAPVHQAAPTPAKPAYTRPTPAPSLQAVEQQAAPSLQTVQPSRQTVQYVWVPANQMAAGQMPAAQMPAAQIPAMQPVQSRNAAASSQTPLAFAPANAAGHTSIANLGMNGGMGSGEPMPINASVPGTGIAPARFDHPQMPQYAWPSYAPYPNYGAVTYPKQYSPMAWPYIGPFYPYPQVPLGWRKVELKWKDGWWQLDFKDRY